jgi:hypothetical protein
MSEVEGNLHLISPNAAARDPAKTSRAPRPSFAWGCTLFNSHGYAATSGKAWRVARCDRGAWLN